MLCSPQIISEMISEIYTVKKCDILKPIIHSQIFLFPITKGFKYLHITMEENFRETQISHYILSDCTTDSSLKQMNRPFSHCLCACVYRSRGALFLDNRRDFTEMGQTDFKPLILSM